MQSEEISRRILNLHFNQTNVKLKQSTLAIGTTKGFKVLNVEDGQVLINRDDDQNL